MTELTYINDVQFVSDAAKLMIEAHLDWSGSCEDMPSRDRNNVKGAMVIAYLRAFSDDEFEKMSDEDSPNNLTIVNRLFVDACNAADRKWEAAMTLLGM